MRLAAASSHCRSCAWAHWSPALGMVGKLPSRVSRPLIAWMTARPLRDDHNEADHNCCNGRGGNRTAEGEAAMIERLIEKVTQSCAEWSRQDERSPEQGDPRHVRPVIECGRDR